MHRIVHNHKENSGRGLGYVGMPAIEQDGNVMVPVKENERFLVNDNKEGIKQFTMSRRMSCSSEFDDRSWKSVRSCRQYLRELGENE
jgi:uncharacterized Zn finger protein (UPF0148 family)